MPVSREDQATRDARVPLPGVIWKKGTFYARRMSRSSAPLGGQPRSSGSIIKECDMELYDLVGMNDLRFSPFCWRTKAALAYKKIPYTTIPVRYVDKDKIAFSGQGQVPVIKDNGTVVYDSWAIAGYLEDKQPDPKLFPGLGLKEACRFFNLYVDRTLNPAIVRVIVPDIFTIVDPADREYFRTTREQRLGVSFAEVAARRDESRLRLHALLADLEATI